MDEKRYPKFSFIVNYSKNQYLHQYRVFKNFHEEYVGEELLNPYKSHKDMKTFYTIQVIDVWHQNDQITPKKIHFFWRIQKCS